MDIFDRTFSHHQPMLKIEVGPVVEGVLERLPNHGAIFRMSLLEDALQRRLSIRADSGNSKGFVGPEKFSVRNTPAKTAGAAQFLSFRQIGPASPQIVFGKFAIVNVRVRSVPLENISPLVAKRRPTKEEPAIFSIEASQARFGFAWLARDQPCATMVL